MSDDADGPMGHPTKMGEREDDGMPERATLGNKDRPERVPTSGHEGSVPVDEKLWAKNNQRKDSARALLDDDSPPLT